ncbi:MAG: response regulator [Anaerolineae bacterium]|nr:response regulator [Anaerolineae bacterium]MEB2287738.1 response regulator [Anaerolineae bacterium]
MFNKAVMAVGDDAEEMEHLSVLLRQQGLAVLKAHDADRALHLIKSLKPDLFLLDVWANGLNSYDLCRWLRANQHTANTPVIILSAFNTPHARRDALASGADLFLPKANLSTELLRAVQSLLERNGHPHTI